jgi:hypothetical protein
LTLLFRVGFFVKQCFALAVPEKESIMAELPDNIADLSEIGDKFQSFYIPDDDGGYVLDDPAVLRRAHENSKRERKDAIDAKRAAEQKLAALGDIDPDEYAKLKTEAQKRRAEGSHDDANFKAWQADAEANWDKKERAYKEQIGVLNTLLEREAVDAPLMAALQEAGATKEGMKALPDLLRPDIKIQIEEGRLQRQVVRPDGTLRYNDSNEEMTMLDRAKEASKEFPSLFSGKEKTGPGGGGSGPIKLEGAFAGKSLSKMDATEKVKLQKSIGREAFDKLVAQEATAQANA